MRKTDTVIDGESNAPVAIQRAADAADPGCILAPVSNAGEFDAINAVATGNDRVYYLGFSCPTFDCTDEKGWMNFDGTEFAEDDVPFRDTSFNPGSAQYFGGIRNDEVVDLGPDFGGYDGAIYKCCLTIEEMCPSNEPVVD